MTGTWPAWVKALTLACAAATLWAVVALPFGQSVLNAVAATVAWLVFLGWQQHLGALQGEGENP
ncbi:MAG TPA: hypothetical protein VHN99_01285 [Deinococcales bacterium]|nr:hypothetical protein [Deinococcales bacterium]